MNTLPQLQQLQMEFAGHLRDPANVRSPQGIEQRRMQIYRDLFYNNVEGFISGGYPVLRSITDDEKWHRMIRDFFSRYRCQTPYFLEIAQEFLGYLQTCREPENDDWPFMLELAHYEWVEMAADTAEGEYPETGFNANGNLLLARPYLSPHAYVVSYHFPVHKIGPDYLPDQPPQNPTVLIVYRDRHLAVRFMEINGVTARLLVLLQENAEYTGRDAIEQVTKELQHPQPEVVLDGGREALQQLFESGIVLGTQLSPVE